MKIFFRLVDLLLVVVISCFITFLFINEKEYVSKEDLPEIVSTSPKNPVNNEKQVPFSEGELSASIRTISEKANPSILWINANDSENAFGTGFVVEWKDKTYILSNYHVIEDADKITAFLFDNKEVNLQLIGFDPSLDLAVLSFEEKTVIPPLSMSSNSNVQIGDFVVAIGHPLGLDYTTTFGIVSKLNRELQLGDNSFTNLIQTDAAINPGNSGGPLFNLKGEVVGINTAIMDDSQGLGFAISIEDVQSILDELITNGKVERPFLGVNITDEEEGVVVIDIYDNAPAAKAGLKQGDVIMNIDHHEIPNVDALTKTILLYKTGETVKVKVKRDGNISVKEIVLGDKNDF